MTGHLDWTPISDAIIAESNDATQVLLGDGTIGPSPGATALQDCTGYSGNPVAVSPSSFTPLTWDGKFSIHGADWLDRSTVDVPKVTAAGVYAITVNFATTSPLTLGTLVTFQLDTTGSAAPTETALATTGALQPLRVISLTLYLPVNGFIRADVSHNDSFSGNFALGQAIITRLS